MNIIYCFLLQPELWFKMPLVKASFQGSWMLPRRPTVRINSTCHSKTKIALLFLFAIAKIYLSRNTMSGNYFHQYFLWASCGSRRRFKNFYSWFCWFSSKYRPVLNFASDYKTFFCIKRPHQSLPESQGFIQHILTGHKLVISCLLACLWFYQPGYLRFWSLHLLDLKVVAPVPCYEPFQAFWMPPEYIFVSSM